MDSGHGPVPPSKKFKTKFKTLSSLSISYIKSTLSMRRKIVSTHQNIRIYQIIRRRETTEHKK